MPDIIALSVAELKEKLSTHSIQVLDIREQADFEAGHIDSALHLTNDTLPQFIAQADKSASFAVCCYRGVSSQAAVLYLKESGFKDVVNVSGGYAAWLEYTA